MLQDPTHKRTARPALARKTSGSVTAGDEKGFTTPVSQPHFHKQRLRVIEEHEPTQSSTDTLRASLAPALAPVSLTAQGTTHISEAQSWLSSPTGLSFRLLAGIQHLHSPVKSSRCCLRSTIPNLDPVYDHEGFHNLVTCDSSLCYHCGRKREEKNASMLEFIIRHTSEDYKYFLGTLTFSTDCGIKEQSQSLQEAYNKWIRTINSRMKNRDSEFHCCWSNDITVDTKSHKTHLHRHFICRVPVGFNYDLAGLLYDSWQSTVRRHTNRSTVSAAFHCQQVADSAAGSKYLYKTCREMAVHRNKNTTGTRLSWFGLGEAILNGAENLIYLYREIVSSMKGRRWFGMSLKMKNDYNEELALLEEQERKDREERERQEREEQEQRFITAIEATPQIHNAICEARALVTLRCVLGTNTDGDKDIEAFRSLVEKWKPILHRDNEDTRLIDKAAQEFYDWAVSTSCGLV